jgi:sialate O-acetylesterase
MSGRWLAAAIGGLAWLGVCTFGAAVARAEVRLHPLFADHAVLQRDTPVKVWGTASPGERVVVQFGKREKATEAAADGKWRVELPAMPEGGPFTLVARGGDGKAAEARDVYLGEVWVASGQSNMHMPVKPNKPWSDGALDHEREIASANWPQIRAIEVERTFAESPADSIKGKWTVCSPQTVGDYSAAAYFFARKLHQDLNVPVGIVLSAVGATGASAWTSREALARDPEMKAKLSQYDQRVRRYPQEVADFERLNPSAKLNDPKRPKDPRRSIGSPALLFNGMIAPLMPYTIRGVIWYQGEGNSQRPDNYAGIMGTLIGDWRARWGQGDPSTGSGRDFPFLFVQLTAHGPQLDQPGDSNWARIREQQGKTLATVPNTGMAVTVDAGSETTVHPPNKQAVGDRLARIALANVYGQPIAYLGPTYHNMRIDGGRLRISFAHADGGLKIDGARPLKFAIAGEDRKFVWADAQLDGNTVILSAPGVPKPVAVRYGWAENPGCNLFNRDGLPASPFRTDDWPSTVQKRGAAPAAATTAPRATEQ